VIHTEILRDLLAPADADGRCYGVVVGVVTNNKDPEGMHRVKVHFPWLGTQDESNWARVVTPMAGGGRGAYFLPEVDDEVLVAFEHGSLEHPCIIGALWNGKDSPPESNSDGQNDNRSITSRSGHVIRLCDRDGSEAIEIIDKSGNNRIRIQSQDNSVSIEAQADISITSQTGKVKIQAMGIELTSNMDVKIQAQTTLDATANAEVTIQGALVKVN
jgi:uncharacterized protein involved in type VI secretion and phage assembly